MAEWILSIELFFWHWVNYQHCVSYWHLLQRFIMPIITAVSQQLYFDLSSSWRIAFPAGRDWWLKFYEERTGEAFFFLAKVAFPFSTKGRSKLKFYILLVNFVFLCKEWNPRYSHFIHLWRTSSVLWKSLRSVWQCGRLHLPADSWPAEETHSGVITLAPAPCTTMTWDHGD